MHETMVVAWSAPPHLSAGIPQEHIIPGMEPRHAVHSRDLSCPGDRITLIGHPACGVFGMRDHPRPQSTDSSRISRRKTASEASCGCPGAIYQNISWRPSTRATSVIRWRTGLRKPRSHLPEPWEFLASAYQDDVLALSATCSSTRCSILRERAADKPDRAVSPRGSRRLGHVDRVRRLTAIRPWRSSPCGITSGWRVSGWTSHRG